MRRPERKLWSTSSASFAVVAALADLDADARRKEG